MGGFNENAANFSQVAYRPAREGAPQRNSPTLGFIRAAGPHQEEKAIMPEIDKSRYKPYVILAGGRIRCLRCTAQSSSTKKQCGKPAMKSSRTQKCTHHGGRSTGPKTLEGKQRIAQAHLVHGKSTKVAKAKYAQDSAKVSMLEDCLHLLKMTDAKRRQGRKAKGYQPMNTLQDMQDFIRRNLV